MPARWKELNPMRVRLALLLAACSLLLPMAAQAQWRWTPETGRWVNIRNMPRETAELQYEHARGLMLEGNLKRAWRETEKFDKWYGDSDFADRNQFLRGEIRMAQGKDVSAAREFQQVVSNYPDTGLFDEVISQQYAIGDKLYERGQVRLNQWWRPFRQRPLRRSAEVYEMVVQNQPFTPEAAEAQYKIGLTHFTRENYYEAAYEYRRVIEDYGGSDWVDEASHGLALCYYELSLPPEYDQSPSRLAIRAIDDFKARFPHDERVQDLDEIRVEMHESIAQQRLQSAQFYEKRRQFPAAKLYYQRVVDQFPGTGAASEAEAWLAAHPGVEAPFAGGIGRERRP